jgi:hypothetical protein
MRPGLQDLTCKPQRATCHWQPPGPTVTSLTRAICPPTERPLAGWLVGRPLAAEDHASWGAVPPRMGLLNSFPPPQPQAPICVPQWSLQLRPPQ